MKILLKVQEVLEVSKFRDCRAEARLFAYVRASQNTKARLSALHDAFCVPFFDSMVYGVLLKKSTPPDCHKAALQSLRSLSFMIVHSFRCRRAFDQLRS
jgi:hypothetical protein